MEALPRSTILEFNPSTLVEVRKELDLDTPGRIEEAIDLLEDWMKKQNHFTKKNFSREYLEITLISTKGLVERAKTRIDKLCTFKTLMPQFYNNTDIRKYSYIDQGVVTHGHLPKLTKDHYRVYVFKVNTDNFESSALFEYYKYTVILSEYLKIHDYCSGFVLVLDFTEVNILNIVTKINLVDLRQAMTLFTSIHQSQLGPVVDYGLTLLTKVRKRPVLSSGQIWVEVVVDSLATTGPGSQAQLPEHTIRSLAEGYGMRIKGLHLITPSKMTDALVSIFKQVLSEKIVQRIHVHKTIDTLYEYVEKEILPVEYGGNAMSLKKINELWIETLTSKEHIEYMKEMFQARTDESCRQADKFNEQYVGMPGSFRSLSVD